MDRAAQGGAFQEFLIGFFDPGGAGDDHLEAPNTAGGLTSHLFFDAGLHPCEVNLVALGDDLHGDGHATPEGCGDQVGGGEAAALALVVDRGVGDQVGPGRGVDGLDIEVAPISHFDFDHVS